MSEFQRFVSYINLYEENRKVRNLGFAKIENRGGQCRIEIHMKGTGYTGISCPAYLFVRKERKMEGVFLGKISIQNGTGEGRFRMDGGNINGSGYRLEQIGGFLIFVNDKIMFASQWDEQEIRREWFVLPEEEPLDSGQGKDAQKPSQNQPQPSGTHGQSGLQPTVAHGQSSSQPSGRNGQSSSQSPGGHSQNPSQQSGQNSQSSSQPTVAHGQSSLPPQGVLKQPVAAASSSDRLPDTSSGSVGTKPQNTQTISAAAKQPPADSALANPPQKPDGQSGEQGITATEAAAAQKILPSQALAQRAFTSSVAVKPGPQASTMPKVPQASMMSKASQASTMPKAPQASTMPKASQASMMQKAASSAVLVQKAASSAAAQRNSQSAAVQKPNSGGNRKNRSSSSVQKSQTPAFEEQEQPWEQKWKFLLENYPVLTPFEGEEDILCIRMELRDLRVLPKRYWYLGNNSFLLHGFFNYRYLIFGVEEKEEAKKWFIGVPGVFQSQEKVMASIFGFPEYKSEKKSGQKTGQFGYWYRYVEL